MKYITKQLHRLEMFESKHPFLFYKLFFPPMFCVLNALFLQVPPGLWLLQLNRNKTKKDGV